MTIQFYNGRQAKIFNIDQTKKQYVKFEDIEDVAWQSKNNYFYYYNFFNILQVKTINGISGSVFAFLTGLTENIQDFFNAIKFKLTNFSYSNGKTSILNNFETLNIESEDVKSNFISSNNINVLKINSDKITSISLKTNEINCNSIKCNNFEYKYNVGIYLYLNNICIPVNKSITKTDLNFNQTITNIQITILPNYMIEFYNNGLIIFTYINNDENIKYFLSVNNNEFTNIKIYYNYILI